MDVESLTEMLMAKLVKLDEIVSVKGDLKLQREAQVYWICYYSLSLVLHIVLILIPYLVSQ